MEKQRIRITAPTDREQVAAILVKNGYTVQLSKERVGPRKTVIYVAFWEEDEDGQGEIVS